MQLERRRDQPPAGMAPGEPFQPVVAIRQPPSGTLPSISQAARRHKTRTTRREEQANRIRLSQRMLQLTRDPRARLEADDDKEEWPRCGQNNKGAQESEQEEEEGEGEGENNEDRDKKTTDDENKRQSGARQVGPIINGGHRRELELGRDRPSETTSSGRSGALARLNGDIAGECWRDGGGSVRPTNWRHRQQVACDGTSKLTGCSHHLKHHQRHNSHNLNGSKCKRNDDNNKGIFKYLIAHHKRTSTTSTRCQIGVLKASPTTRTTQPTTTKPNCSMKKEDGDEKARRKSGRAPSSSPSCSCCGCAMDSHKLRLITTTTDNQQRRHLHEFGHGLELKLADEAGLASNVGLAGDDKRWRMRTRRQFCFNHLCCCCCANEFVALHQPQQAGRFTLASLLAFLVVGRSSCRLSRRRRRRQANEKGGRTHARDSTRYQSRASNKSGKSAIVTCCYRRRLRTSRRLATFVSSKRATTTTNPIAAASPKEIRPDEDDDESCWRRGRITTLITTPTKSPRNGFLDERCARSRSRSSPVRTKRTITMPSGGTEIGSESGIRSGRFTAKTMSPFEDVAHCSESWACPNPLSRAFISSATNTKLVHVNSSREENSNSISSNEDARSSSSSDSRQQPSRSSQLHEDTSLDTKTCQRPHKATEAAQSQALNATTTRSEDNPGRPQCCCYMTTALRQRSVDVNVGDDGNKRSINLISIERAARVKRQRERAESTGSGRCISINSTCEPNDRNHEAAVEGDHFYDLPARPDHLDYLTLSRQQTWSCDEVSGQARGCGSVYADTDADAESNPENEPQTIAPPTVIDHRQLDETTETKKRTQASPRNQTLSIDSNQQHSEQQHLAASGLRGRLTTPSRWILLESHSACDSHAHLTSLTRCAGEAQEDFVRDEQAGSDSKAPRPASNSLGRPEEVWPSACSRRAASARRRSSTPGANLLNSMLVCLLVLVSLFNLQLISQPPLLGGHSSSIIKQSSAMLITTTRTTTQQMPIALLRTATTSGGGDEFSPSPAQNSSTSGSSSADELSRAVLATMSTQSSLSSVNSTLPHPLAQTSRLQPAGGQGDDQDPLAGLGTENDYQPVATRLPGSMDGLLDEGLMASSSSGAILDNPNQQPSNGSMTLANSHEGRKSAVSKTQLDEFLTNLTDFSRIFAMVAIMIGDICGNSLVILSVVRHSKLRMTTNWFVVSLACADILVALFAMTFNASVQITGRWIFPRWMCDFWNSCDVLASTASILHLCCISIDRYYAITRPLEYPMKITTRRVCYALAVVWISSALLSYVPIFSGIYTTSEHIVWQQQNPDQCDFVVNRVYAIVSSSISFWIPCCIMVCTYYRIYKEATRQEKFIYKAQNMLPAPQPNHHHSNSRAKQRRSKSMAVTSLTTGGAKGPNNAGDKIKQLAKQTPANEQTSTTPSAEGAPAATATANSIGLNQQAEQQPLTGSAVDLNNNSQKAGAGLAGKAAVKIQQHQDDQDDRDSNSGQSTPTKRSISKMKREHKAAKTLGIIMGVFILCWLPFFSWYTAQHICGHDCDGIIPSYVVTLLFWVGYFNSTLNPIIYAYFNHEFRDAFKKTLQWIFCCCRDLKCLRVNRPNDNQHYNCTYRSTQEIGLVTNG